MRFICASFPCRDVRADLLFIVPKVVLLFVCDRRTVFIIVTHVLREVTAVSSDMSSRERRQSLVITSAAYYREGM